jgi:hypothetical protein
MKLLFITHVLANLWTFVGIYSYKNKGLGWVTVLIKMDMCESTEFLSLYLTAFYWVITTFSSIGYGEIKGNTLEEYCVAMFVQMIGIGFFGYMVGTFQKIISSFNQNDYHTDKTERISLWLVRLDKTRGQTALQKNVYREVVEIYAQQLRWDIRVILENSLYD